MLRPEKKAKRFTAYDAGWWVAMGVATVSGLFCLSVASLLIVNYLQVQAINPLDNPELIELRRQLAQTPQTDERLVQEIRAMDLLARKAFFTSQRHLNMGAHLLLGGAVVMAIAWRIAGRCKPKVPQPAELLPSEAFYWLTRARARELLAFSGALWVLAALAAAYFTRLDYPVPPDRTEVESGHTTAAMERTYPDWETMQQNWPSFRGPGGYGVGIHTNTPVDWDLESGRNIRWSAEIPLPGTNSPVIWGKRLYLSGADKSSREIYCFDTEAGEMLWRRAAPPFPGTPAEPPKILEETGYAAPTMAVQEDRAFAIFANGDLMCVDADGELKWGRNLGVPDNHYGHASSLLAYRDLLFVQYDQRSDGKLLALDIESGREVWTVPRATISWSSPAYIHTVSRPQLVLVSSRDVRGYDPMSGGELWQVECLSGEVATGVGYANGMFFVASEYSDATAIRIKEESGRFVPEIAWQWHEALPDVASPLAAGKHLYIATSRGEMVCLDAESGEVVWFEEYDEGFYSSPILMGEKIYAIDKQGAGYVFRPGDSYELLGEPKLGQETVTTPAFMDGRIFIRTKEQLVCIADSHDS